MKHVEVTCASISIPILNIISILMTRCASFVYLTKSNTCLVLNYVLGGKFWKENCSGPYVLSSYHDINFKKSKLLSSRFMYPSNLVHFKILFLPSSVFEFFISFHCDCVYQTQLRQYDIDKSEIISKGERVDILRWVSQALFHCCIHIAFFG